MRTHTERKTHIYRDDEDWGEFTMAWGSLVKPIRCKPTSVSIEWRKDHGEDWTLWRVDVFADRIHPQTRHSVIAYYHFGKAEFGAPMMEHQALDPAPHTPAWAWLDELIKVSHPFQESAHALP